MSDRSIRRWWPPDEPSRREFGVVVPPRGSASIRMPAICVVCGASPSASETTAEPRLHSRTLPVVVEEPAVGCFGEFMVRVEFGFPICEHCARTNAARAARAVRVLGARGHFNGATVHLAFRNRRFGRAFAAAVGRG